VESLIRLKDVAKILSIHPKYVSNFIKKHGIPKQRVNARLVYVKEADLQAFLKKNIEENNKKNAGVKK